MMLPQRRVVLYLLFLIVNSAVFADQPRELIEQGNQHFEAGRYTEALEAYDQVGDEPDELLAAELLHNRAAAHFKLGELDEARDLWVRAAGLRDETFEAAARYNLGNCDYAAALRAAEQQDAQGSLEQLDRAIAQYRDALKLDPQLARARANLELAAQLKKQIEEMSEQQPQSQPSTQPDQQEQQEQQEQNQNQSSSRPSSQPSEPDQQQGDSESQQQEQSESQQEQSPQPDTQPSPDSQPTEQQSQGSEGEQAQEQQAQEQQPLIPIELTREEAERLLQMIRDSERERRAILRAREAAAHKGQEVDKDW